MDVAPARWWHDTAAVAPSPNRSPLPILIAAILGLAGVGAIASGIVLLASSAHDTTGSTTAATTTPLITTAPTTSLPVDAAGFVELIDDSGVLAISVPAVWQDVETSAWNRDGVDIGPSLTAATDRAAWIAGWDTPGMFVGATDQIGFEDAFGDFSDACVLDSTTPIEAGGLAGSGEWWTDCGAEGSDFFVGVVSTSDAVTIVVFQIAAIDGGIEDLVAHLLTTFRYQ